MTPIWWKWKYFLPWTESSGEGVIIEGRREGYEVRKYKEQRGCGGRGKKLKKGQLRTREKWSDIKGGRMLV